MTFRLFLFLGITACAPARVTFAPLAVPPPPDYRRLEAWAAHPDKTDPADSLPVGSLVNVQDTAGVDVFFVHPTILTEKRYRNQWNGDVRDARLNNAVDASATLYQASLFNGAGRVFAPRYRQAHLEAFYGSDTASARQALEVAYRDVQAAFDAYLRDWNKGRPFVLAGHSQGSRHILYLLRDRIENQPIEKRLVAAYVVGWPVDPRVLKRLQPCTTPDQTGCYCTWRTWERRYGRKHADEDHIVCTNPLNWTTAQGAYAPREQNLGGVVAPFNRTYPGITDAEVYRGILLADRPRFRGSFFFRRKNYHIGDLNLYYLNVRENAARRANAFQNRR